MKKLAILAALALLTACNQPPRQDCSTPTPATETTTAQNAPAPAAPAVPVGRFVIVHSPHVEKDTTLLDTATGRTWQLALDPKQNEVWQEFGQDNGQPMIPE